MPDADVVTAAFADRHRSPPAGVWAAPGRVNLIGEHTDYNDGFVMPFALAQRVTVAAGPAQTTTGGRVTSLSHQGTETFGRDDLVPGRPGWSAYVAGVVWALEEAGHHVAGADLVLTSDVPVGAGLSSSAALECAVLTALVDLNGLERRAAGPGQARPAGRERVRRRPDRADGPGRLDAVHRRPRPVLRLPQPSPPSRCRSTCAAAGLELLVLDTSTPHALVDSEYATRRASCEEAARLLGVAALRDVTDLDAALAPAAGRRDARRVRHVVTENARVLAAAELLRAGRVAELGPLLDASHASMRDDFEITVPTVDLAVETARAAGALGARMTGGGFGGCIIALLPTGRPTRWPRRSPSASRRPGSTRPRTSSACRRPEPVGSAETAQARGRDEHLGRTGVQHADQRAPPRPPRSRRRSRWSAVRGS